MIKVMAVSFCLIGIYASPGHGCVIWKGNCFHRSEISQRLDNSGYIKMYP